MISEPSFSIVLAIKNRADTLVRCLTSVINQAYSRKEVIVIDGGSRDLTREVLISFGKAISFWESAPDRGIYHAFNKGIKRATGEWIYFLGADDFLWSPDVLTQMGQHIREMPSSTRLVYGSIDHLGVTGRVLKTTGCEWERTHDFTKMPVDHQALFHHASLFRDYGLYDERYRVVSDYEFQLRTLLGHNEPCRFVPVTIAVHPHGGLATLRRDRLRIFIEAEALRRQYSVRVPVLKRVYNCAGALFWATLAHAMGENYALTLEEWLLLNLRLTSKDQRND